MYMTMRFWGQGRFILSVVQWLHIVIYVTMVTAVFFTLYCGIIGTRGPWLAVAIGLVFLEGAVLILNGWRCPLTNVAKRYGAAKGYVFEGLLSEKAADLTFPIFGTLFLLGLLLLAIRW